MLFPREFQAWLVGRLLGLIGAAALSLASASTSGAATLHIGYSDWPGWVAWQVAIDKGWLQDAGADAKPVPRPRRPKQALEPAFRATRGRLDALIHPPADEPADEVLQNLVMRLTASGNDVE